MAAHTSSWYATTQTHRPQGVPGSYTGEHGTTRHNMVCDRDGLLWAFNVDTDPDRTFWTPARGADVSGFIPDPDAPEWAADCTHDPACTSERDCDALHKEQGSGDW